jgi:aminoglycoside N3'-acetyltransferase
MNFSQVLDSKLANLDVSKYDILYIYSDLRELGKFKSASESKEEFLQQIIGVLLKNVSTVITPTFTYTTSGIFEVQSTPTRLGALNAHFLKDSSVQRSEHPIFSFASIGTFSHLTKNIGKSAFGIDSIFERLLSRKTAFLYIGRPVRLGNTMIHFVEQLNNVDYRLEKIFETKVYDNGKFIGDNYSAFVRKRDNLKNTYEFSFKRATEVLIQKKLVRQIWLTKDFSNLSLLPYSEVFEELNSLIKKDLSVFLKKPL